jgi:hypothetical protein
LANLNNTIYARSQNIVLGQAAFNSDDFDQIEYIKNTIIGSLKTRHLGYNFTTDKSIYSDDMAKHFDVFVCTKSFIITLTDFSREIKLDIGDYIAFPSELNYSTRINNESYIYFEAYYWPIVESEKNGSKSYNIVATLTDKYEVTVYADSEEEAYDKAYNTPLSAWKHLTPGGIAKPRKIIRWAEWGNFETKEIND